jgi:hypothetical protein
LVGLFFIPQPPTSFVSSTGIASILRYTSHQQHDIGKFQRHSCPILNRVTLLPTPSAFTATIHLEDLTLPFNPTVLRYLFICFTVGAKWIGFSLLVKSCHLQILHIPFFAFRVCNVICCSTRWAEPNKLTILFCGKRCSNFSTIRTDVCFVVSKAVTV